MLRLGFLLVCLAALVVAIKLQDGPAKLNGPTAVRNAAARARRPSHRVKAADPDYTTIIQRLWNLDVNGMNSTTMVLALQGITTTTSTVDKAPASLFTFVNKDFLSSRPTVVAMMALVDNYIRAVGTPEVDTNEEAREIDAFLNAICDTEVMRAALIFLQENGPALRSLDMAGLRAKIKEIWFTSYPRSKNWANPIDTSGFEHVFLGEVKKDKSIGGLHNWIIAYFLELNGQFDYTGYISGYTRISPGRYVFGAKLNAYSSNWKSPFSSFIFGSSPEFDIASYTICFLVRPGKACSFTLDNKALSIKTMKFSNYIDTAYPDVQY